MIMKYDIVVLIAMMLYLRKPLYTDNKHNPENLNVW